MTMTESTLTQPTLSYPAWPVYAEDEIEAAAAVLRSGKVNYWTGDKVKAFEKAFADKMQANYAIAVANGTVALELALLGLDIKAGDEVIVPCRGFIATASSVVQRGATPVLADVDPVSQNISLQTILPHVTDKTRAIIVVHHAGWPVDLDPILTFCREHDVFLIEDCAQAHGACYKGKPVGSLGDAAAFSFCQDKILSTGGEGGMVLCQDEARWKRMWSFKDHGKGYDAVFHREHANGYRWLHETFGTNWRMTEVQAAIGLCQLAKLDSWVASRRQNADCLRQGLLAETDLLVPVPETDDFFHAYYKFYAFAHSASQRDQVLTALNQQGIPCAVGSCANFAYEAAFQTLSLARHPMPQSERLSETSLVFLVHPGCDEALMRKIVQIIQLQQKDGDYA